MQKEEEDHLKFLAESDSLTHLYNHRTAKKRVSASLSGAGLSALLFFDVDNFKSVNDFSGHMIGDSVLKQRAKNVSGKIRATDIAARVGGDEFLVFLNGLTDCKHLEEQVEALWRTMQVCYDYHVFTVSVGVSVYPKNGTDYDTLFSCADKALYACKRQGKTNMLF